MVWHSRLLKEIHHLFRFPRLVGIQFPSVVLAEGISMPNLFLPIRSFLATSFVVSMLLCCCHGKVVGGVVAQFAVNGTSTGQVEKGGCCLEGEGDESPASGSEHGPCECRGQVDVKTLPEAKTTIDLAGATPVILVLAAGRVEPMMPPVVRVAVLETWAHVRPPTSLLRQHCALIV